MHPWAESNLRLGLTGAEVEVIEIVGDGLVEGRQLSIDQQMVMTGIRTIQSGGCNPHLLQRRRSEAIDAESRYRGPWQS